MCLVCFFSWSSGKSFSSLDPTNDYGDTEGGFDIAWLSQWYAFPYLHTGFLCSPGCPGTCNVDQAGLKLHMAPLPEFLIKDAYYHPWPYLLFRNLHRMLPFPVFKALGILPNSVYNTVKRLSQMGLKIGWIEFRIFISINWKLITILHDWLLNQTSFEICMIMWNENNFLVK